MKLKSYISVIGLLAYLCHAGVSSGLSLINETGEPIRVRIDGRQREHLLDLPAVHLPATNPAQVYFADEPRHITVYSHKGSASTFYNVGMNPVFNTLHIRKQGACTVIGYAGKTRTRPARNIPFVIFNADDCKLRGWNPATGAMYTDLHTTTSAAAPVNFQLIR